MDLKKISLTFENNSTNRQRSGKLNEDAVRKRFSISSIQEESTLKNLVPHISDAFQPMTYLNSVSFNECPGIDNVVVTPSYMEFRDGSEGATLRQVLTIQNFGKKAAFVRIKEPNSLTFEIKNIEKRGYRLYPGLRLTKVVCYSYKVPSTNHAIIPIEINGNNFDYHLTCTSSNSLVSVQPLLLDFGRVNIGSLSDIKKLTLANVGGKSARFSVDVKNNKLDVVVQPPRGVVRPEGKLVLAVQASGKREGLVHSELWIKSTRNMYVSMKMRVIVPQFIIDHPITMNNYSLINFSATYAGTQRYVNFKLTNFSSDATSFLVFNQDIEKLTSIQELDPKKCPTFDAFKIWPLEGTLQPFEDVLFTVIFCPTVKALKLLQKYRHDKRIDHFVAVIQICQIQATEAKSVLNTQPPSGTFSESAVSQYTICSCDNLNENLVDGVSSRRDKNDRLCSTIYLHGGVEIPKLSFEPNSFNLGELSIDEKVKLVIRVTNPSKQISVKFTFVPKPYIRCEPQLALLMPKQSVEVVVTIQVQFNLEPLFNLEFDMLAESMTDYESNKMTRVKVARAAINLEYTPLKAHAKVKPPSKVCRAVSFNKLTLEPDYSLTYTPSELDVRMNHREFWMHYFRQIFAHANKTMSLSVESVYCGKDFHDFCDISTASKPYDFALTQKSLRRYIQLKRGETDEDNLSRHLSPLQIYKIDISPEKLNFGKVIKETLSHQELKFENANDFPVLVSIISVNPTILIYPEVKGKVVMPNKFCTFNIGFYPKYSRKYDLFINYAINGSHRYQLPVTAHVVNKSIVLKQTEIVFYKDYYPQEAYRLAYKVVELANKLNADTKFKWSIPDDCNFTIEPNFGTVPSDRRLCVCICQHFHPTNLNRVEATLQLESGSRSILKLDIPLRPPNVLFLSPAAQLDDIALNVKRETAAVLYNAEYFAVFFEVNEEALLRGIKVVPTRGIISPRGIVILHISLKFNACVVDLSTTIDVVVQKRLTLQFKLDCSVVIPKIKFNPSQVQMKRISTNACQVQEISATNLSKSCVSLQFLLDEFPEFRVSLSPLKTDKMIDNNSEILELTSLSTLKFYLHFTPCDLASYFFDLPIIINEILGPVTAEKYRMSDFLQENENYYSDLELSCASVPTRLPTVNVKCTVAQPFLCFNNLAFNLDERVNQAEFRICNVTQEKMHITLITESLNSVDNCPFTISPTRENIEESNEKLIKFSLVPQTQIRFEILFKPNNCDHFVSEIPINLNDADNVKLYNKLVLRGSHLAQSIKTDVLDIYLFPTPLNVATKETFSVRIENCTKPTSIRAKISSPDKCCGEFNSETLKITFPTGSSIRPCCEQELEVELEFKSSVPVSFCTKVVLSDMENSTSTSINVYATADNNLLTTRIIQKTSPRNFVLTKERKYPAELGFNMSFDKNSTHEEQERDESKAGSIHSSQSKVQSTREERLLSLESRKSYQSQIKESTYFSDFTSQSSCESETLYDLFYMFFPDSRGLHVESHPLIRVSSVIKSWLYSRVLKYQFNPTISDGLTAPLSRNIKVESNGNSDKSTTNIKLCSFIDVINNLVNPNDFNTTQFVEKITGHEYEDELEYVNDVIKIYETILEYLMSKGACVAHISSEFLLSFDQYEILRKSEKDIDDLLPKHVFTSRGKYSWLDLLLQTYKCLVLIKIDETSFEKHSALMQNAKAVDSVTYESSSFDIDDIKKRVKKHCKRAKPEAILLAWLEFNYSLYFGEKCINGFDVCLNDGLAFIATMLNYCPFLKDEFFDDIFVNPTRTDEKTHNVACLTMAWKKLRLGFIVTPAQIVHADCVHMLMLSVHLFLNLPTYLLKNKIVFNCALTKTRVKQVKLSIDSLHTAQYVVQYFGSNTDLFTSKSIVSVYPRKSQQIKITYHARKILKVNVFLVLCGSAIGPHFAENQTFLLEAFPDELENSGEYTIRSKLYQITEKTVEISVPYSYEDQYEIWLSHERPSSFDELKIYPWAEKQYEKVPKRFIFHGKTLRVEENAYNANLFMIVTNMVAESRSIWIIFRSALADFIIQINSNYQTLITDTAFIELSDEECMCPTLLNQVLFECPRNKKFDISIKNTNLEKCVVSVFQKTLNDEEMLFWANHLDNNIALRLIKWLIYDTKDVHKQEFHSIFNPAINYKITVNKSNVLTIARSLIIEDEHFCNDFIQLTVHVSKNDSELTDALVTFTSFDKMEIRVCKLLFQRRSNSIKFDQISQQQMFSNQKINIL